MLGFETEQNKMNLTFLDCYVKLTLGETSLFKKERKALENIADNRHWLPIVLEAKINLLFNFLPGVNFLKIASNVSTTFFW